MAGNEVRIRASVDDKVSGALDKIRDKFDTVGKSAGFKSLVQGVGIGAGISVWGALGRSVSTATGFIDDSITAASDLNETMSKANVVFGESSDKVSTWGDSMAGAFGLSKQAAIEAAATFGNLFNQIGVAKPEVASMSEKLVELAGDLASFNNIDPGVALEKLRSGLAGEAEPLRTVGVFLSEAKVDAEAAALGFHKVGGQYAENAKILARYNIILRETGSAQGDFGRTAGGMANQQRILAAELKNTEARLGQDLIPVVIKAQRVFIDLFEAIEGHQEQLSGIGASIADEIAAGTLEGLEKSKAALEQGIKDFSVGNLGPLPSLKEMFQGGDLDALKKNLADVDAAIADLRARAGYNIENMRGEIHDSFDHSTDDIENFRSGVHEKAVKVERDFIKIGEHASNAAKVTRDAWSGAADALIDDFFDPIDARAAIFDAHSALYAALEAKRKAKSRKDTREATDDIESSIQDEVRGLQKLRDKHALTQKDIDNFAKDTKTAYAGMGKKIPAELQKIIDDLRKVASYDGKHYKFYVNGIWKDTGDTHGPGHGSLVHAAGAVGFTNGAMRAPDGGVMGEAGTEAYAILRNPKRIPAGGSVGGGGNVLNLTVHAGPGMTAGAGRELAKQMLPPLVAEMRRQGFLPRTATGLTG